MRVEVELESTQEVANAVFLARRRAQDDLAKLLIERPAFVKRAEIETGASVLLRLWVEEERLQQLANAERSVSTQD